MLFRNQRGGGDDHAGGVAALLEDAQGRRLAKRDGDTDLTALAKRFSREEILGMLACSAGLLDENRPATMEELIDTFDWEKVRTEDMRLPLSF